MNGSRILPLVLLVAINFLLDSPASAGVVKRSIRMVREVYPPDIEPENEGNQPPVCIVGDVVYGQDETVPAEQPCLKCRCQPPGVQCETVQCAKKPGCKAIHRPNKCCPDYQCECEHNGKIYANGEKLETNPGGECKVCYCRGGELQCAEVSCYIRNDCEGKRVPGTCCPKYDHCPPIDAVLDRSSVVTEPSSNTTKPVTPETLQEPNTTEVPFLPTLNSIPEDSNKVPDTSSLVTSSPVFEEIPNKEDTLQPRITIQEIIPERKEIPITAPPKIYISEPQGTLIIEESLPTSENTSNDLNFDTEPESSEVSEVFQHPPPVLRIGGKLIFLKKGKLVPENDTSTSDSIITIFGAEGLQRGGIEESLEIHEVKIEPETEVQDIQNDDDIIKDDDIKNDDVKATLDINPKIIVDQQQQNKSALNNSSNYNFETFGKPFISVNKEIENESARAETNDLELKLAESTHILSLVKRKDKTLTTTSTQAPTTQKEEVLTSLTSSIEEPRVSESQSQVTEAAIEIQTTTLPTSTTKTNDAKVETDTLTTIPPSTDTRTEGQAKNTEPAVEQNPAYPYIPDIMPAAGDVSQKFEVELENDNATTMDIKILPDIYDFLSNKTKNDTHSEWLKSSTEQKRNDTLLEYIAAKLPEELLNQKSPIDEEEDTSTDATTVPEDATTISAATTEIKMDKSENIILFKAIQPDETVDIVSTNVTAISPVKPKKAGTSELKLLEEGAQLIAEVKMSENKFENIKPVSESPTIVNISATVTHTKVSERTFSPNTIGLVFKPNPSFDDSEDENATAKIKPTNSTDNLRVVVFNDFQTMHTSQTDNEESKQTNISKADSEETKTQMPKSIESLEIDSGEQTTPKTNSSMMSNENASIESIQKEANTESPSESKDMTQIPSKETSIELGSVEIADNSSETLMKDVEIIGTSNSAIVQVTTEKSFKDNLMKQEVELINLQNTAKPTKLASVETSTYERLPTPEEAKSKKLIKRQIDSEEDVFRDLERELNAETSNSSKDPKEERSEADNIFKELLDESKGNRAERKPKSKEQENVDNISNALAGIALKGQKPDANIFRLIGGLLGGQRE